MRFSIFLFLACSAYSQVDAVLDAVADHTDAVIDDRVANQEPSNTQAPKSDALSDPASSTESLSKITLANENTPAPLDRPDAASGVSPLPERPMAVEFTFAGTPVKEVILRLGNEYGLSFVFMGDSGQKISGKFSRAEEPAEVLGRVFPSPQWTVRKHAGSWLITETPPVIFPTIKFSEL